MNPIDTPEDDDDVHKLLKKQKSSILIYSMFETWSRHHSSSQCLRVPEQPDAKTDHHVVERVEAHHAHQQILQNNLRRRNTCRVMMPCRCEGFNLTSNLLCF